MGTRGTTGATESHTKPVAIAVAMALLVAGWSLWGARERRRETETETTAAARRERSETKSALARPGGESASRLRGDTWAEAVRARRERRRSRGADLADSGPDGRASVPRPMPHGRRPALAGADAPAAGAPLSSEDEEEAHELTRVALTDPDPDEREMALWSLTGIGDEVALPVLSKALSDPSRDVRLTAVGELANLSDAKLAIEPAAQALQDMDSEVRIEALRVLADIEDERALEAVKTLLEDPDPEVQEEARDIVDFAAP